MEKKYACNSFRGSDPWVGSGGFENVAGLVGSGHEVFEIVVVVAASATMQSVVTGQP